MPKVRNEFGLDNENALDVKKERTKRLLPYVAGMVALPASFVFMMFVLPNMSNNSGTHVPPASTTTMSGTR